MKKWNVKRNVRGFPVGVKNVALVVLAVFLTAGIARAQVVERPIPGDPVKTADGLVSGKLLSDGVRAYLGLRYAKPPTGNLRWKAPQPLAPWKGVYHADRKMPECVQVLRPHNINHYFGEEATSEDCLFMNIWVPGNAKPGDKLPVVVFIYGGAFTVGSSGMALYGGENVARSGAIFVNFNYRLGILGFMAGPELTAESPHHSSGNYGFLDQIAALRWIHRNISAFGGDPSKVIITGQSAGATSTSVLQASPLAKGLFRGVVAMSGGVWARGPKPELPTLAEAEKTGPEVRKLLQVQGIKALRQVPADQILALQEQFQLGHHHKGLRVGGPNVDGYLLPAQPAALFAEHKANEVPVILGYARDEAKGFGSNPLTRVQTVSQLNAAVDQLYSPEAVAEFHKLYPATTDAQARVAAGDALRNAFFSEQSAWWWANEQGRMGEPAYVYEFAHVQPFNPAVPLADHPERIGAFHTSDVPYWFQTLDSLNMFRPTRLWKPADRQLARTMTSMLISFAKTGSPTRDSAAAPEWPAFSPVKPHVLVIGDGASTAFGHKLMPAARLKFQAANRPAFPTREPASKKQKPQKPQKPFSHTRD